jgi:hypothetical protein
MLHTRAELRKAAASAGVYAGLAQAPVVAWTSAAVQTVTLRAACRVQGLLEEPGYEHLREGIDTARCAADALRAARQPLPRLVLCDQGTSQARFLLARLNPSRTQENTDGQAVGSVIYTDDVSYDTFVGQLKRLTVA